MNKLIHLSDACDLMEKYASRNPDVSSLCYDIRYGLMRLPTISPDDVRGVGKWIEKEVYNLECTTIEQMQSASCSVCGKIHTTPFLYYFSKYNYCPNCGARMKGVSEDA